MVKRCSKYIFIGLKKRTCLGCFRYRGDTWQRQWNRFEKGRRNRNVNTTSAFPYTRLHALFRFVFTYLFHIANLIFYFQVLTCNDWQPLLYGTTCNLLPCHRLRCRDLLFFRFLFDPLWIIWRWLPYFFFFFFFSFF